MPGIWDFVPSAKGMRCVTASLPNMGALEDMSGFGRGTADWLLCSL